MTASVPDGISFSDLENLMANAQQEPEQTTESDDLDNRIHDIAQRHLQAALEEFDSPLVHKAMIMAALANMIDWHTRVGQEYFQEGEIESGTAWMRDAGKFQAAINILMAVTVGPDDQMITSA